MMVGNVLQPGLPKFCTVGIPHLFCIFFCELLCFRFENVKSGREAVIAHILAHFSNASSMARGRACSFLGAFCRDFRPLALSFSVNRGTSNSVAKSWKDVPSRSLFPEEHRISSSIAAFLSCRTLTRGMVVAVDDEQHHCNLRTCKLKRPKIREKNNV